MKISKFNKIHKNYRDMQEELTIRQEISVRRGKI